MIFSPIFSTPCLSHYDLPALTSHSERIMVLNASKALESIDASFEASILPTLIEYIKIPNLSPAFNGGKFDEPETEQVISLFAKWVEQQNVPNLTLSVRRLPNRTPLMCLELPASPDYSDKEDSVLLYGHLDKQPPFEGWLEGLGPYTPVLKDGRLYGRGGADDGYALFGSVEAIKEMHRQKIPHAKCIVLIEACEESGSPDLPAHLAALVAEGKLGTVSLVICLDSGAASYDTLFMTTSIRGLLMTKLTVSTLTEGVHSGGGGGICADSFRIVRQLLSSIEDENTGEIVSDFQVDVPQKRLEQNATTANLLGESVWRGFPLVNGVPMEPADDPETLSLNRGWRAGLTVTGIDGLGSCATGGNVLRPSTTLKLSIRLPPSYDDKVAFDRLKTRFEKALPKNAKMELSPPVTARGWDAPPFAPWLESACEAASSALFGKPPCCIFEGGSIPFLGMLQDMFPSAQFCVTGVLGPHSNAHGPNEFLDVEYCKKVVVCVAGVLAAHGTRGPSERVRGPAPDLAAAEARIAGAHEDKMVQRKCCE